MRVASNRHLCAGSCSRPSCARSWRALWGLTERGETGSAHSTPGRVRAHAIRVYFGDFFFFLNNHLDFFLYCQLMVEQFTDRCQL